MNESMINLNPHRRGFLKLLGASVSTILVPVPEFILASPDVVIPEMPIILGKIRELIHYDIHSSQSIFRLDAFNGKAQFSVDFMCSISENEKERSIENYLGNRRLAQDLLRERLIEEKWNVSDMILLPIYDQQLTVPDWLKG